MKRKNINKQSKLNLYIKINDKNILFYYILCISLIIILLIGIIYLIYSLLYKKNIELFNNKKMYKIMTFWHGFNYNNNIFTNNITNNLVYTENIDEANIIICGPFINEHDYDIISSSNAKKILYITEPIEQYSHYNNTLKLFNENKFNVITGCINKDHDKNRYKYPLFLQNFNYKDSKNIFDNVNNYVKTCYPSNKKFCCLIATHDTKNTRTAIYDKLKDINHITCPSNLFNNCSNEELNNIGNVEYIKQFKYNICSENCITNIEGYITEKLLNCTLSGTIPIYCGSFDEIDEKIFNKNRILLYDPNNEESINNIRNIVINFENNIDEFNNFYNQNVFCDDAHEVILQFEKDLKFKLNSL